MKYIPMKMLVGTQRFSAYDLNTTHCICIVGRGAIGVSGRSIDLDANFVGVPVFPALLIYNRTWCLL